MKIGLIDVDGHNYPNLALMKLSAWHKKQGHKVEFAEEGKHYEIVFRSKTFSFTEDKKINYTCDNEKKGGSGYFFKTHDHNNLILPENINNICPDYSLYNCDHAYGFLTRGCIRKCHWCIVPQKEGNIKPEHDIDDFIADYKSAILMDNNVLACDHGIKQIKKIIKMGIKIDFNQGLDARLIDDSIAKLLSKVKWIKTIRLACDSSSQIETLFKAVKNLRWRNCRPIRYFVYCLVQDTKEAMERVKEIKGIYCEPFCQPFIDFNKKILPGKRIKRFARWVNATQVFNSVWWENYKYK